MKSREEIVKEIESLEEKYNKSRNVVEKARFTAQIKELNIELNALDVELEKKVVYQNDAPSIADHKNTREVCRGDIANAGTAFIGII